MSRSEMAQAMQAQIRAQLEAGRSEEEVLRWFEERYGPAVLLDPRGQGAGVLLRLVPAAVLVAGLVATVVVVRRRPGSEGPAAGSVGEDARDD